MDILPAIDLRGAEVVRLAQGNYDLQTTYSSMPATVAKEFIECGAKWIHVVDLDAAKTGNPTNLSGIRIVRKTASASGVRIQLGGGARDYKTVEYMLAELADRVVVGSAALKNWRWFERLVYRTNLCGKIALGLDARDGRLAIQGWTEEIATSPLELAKRVKGWPLGAIVYTDISRDGMLAGPNFDATAELIAATDVPVIASGGISSIKDVKRCKEIGCGGVIIGRAYYEGRIDLAAACLLAQQQL